MLDNTAQKYSPNLRMWEAWIIITKDSVTVLMDMDMVTKYIRCSQIQ